MFESLEASLCLEFPSKCYIRKNRCCPIKAFSAFSSFSISVWLDEQIWEGGGDWWETSWPIPAVSGFRRVEVFTESRNRNVMLLTLCKLNFLALSNSEPTSATPPRAWCPRFISHRKTQMGDLKSCCCVTGWFFLSSCNRWTQTDSWKIPEVAEIEEVWPIDHTFRCWCRCYRHKHITQDMRTQQTEEWLAIFWNFEYLWFKYWDDFKASHNRLIHYVYSD